MKKNQKGKEISEIMYKLSTFETREAYRKEEKYIKLLYLCLNGCVIIINFIINTAPIFEWKSLANKNIIYISLILKNSAIILLTYFTGFCLLFLLNKYYYFSYRDNRLMIPLLIITEVSALIFYNI